MEILPGVTVVKYQFHSLHLGRDNLQTHLHILCSPVAPLHRHFCMCFLEEMKAPRMLEAFTVKGQEKREF